MTHLADKMKLLAQGASGFTKKVEELIDGVLAEQHQAQAEVTEGLGKSVDTIRAVHEDAKAGVAALQSELKGLTNQ